MCIPQTITLYHGTDARILEMTKEEKEQYIKDCNLVIDALFPFYKSLLTYEKIESKDSLGRKIYVFEYALKMKYEKLLNEKGGQYMYLNLYEKVMMIDSRNNNSGWYQYNDLYLCSSKIDAMDYARRSFAGGETGLNAYRLIQGAEIIGFEKVCQDPKVKHTAERIIDFAKEGNERPAIVTIDNVDVNYLLYEDGRALDKDDLHGFDRMEGHHLKYRYTKPVELNKCKVEQVNKELYKQIIEEEQ